MKPAVLLLILLLMLSPWIALGEVHPVGEEAVSESTTRRSSIDFDKIFTALQEGKLKKPQKFEEMQKLLYIPPFITENYSTELLFGLDFPGNKTLNRTQKFDLFASLVNPNPIETRRALFLDLEILEPGERAFRQVNSEPQVIHKNEYEEKDGMNFSYRVFPELRSFSDLKKTGDVVLRAKAFDGINGWISENLTLHVINNPPIMFNFSIQSPDPPRYKDRIEYLSNLTDRDGDLANVTIHVLDASGKERGAASQQFWPGERISFQAAEYGFFGKEDAGKNFTYYYTFGDGINVSNTTIQDGPRLKKSAAIWVDNPRVIPEDENQYWWQSYNFSIDMKNQDLGEVKVLVSLFVDTPAHPWKPVLSQDVVLTQEQRPIFFNVRPFDVLDANQTFAFRFNYTEYDQHGGDNAEVDWTRPLNAKLVKYEWASPLGVGNWLAVILACLAMSVIVERRFYR